MENIGGPAISSAGDIWTNERNIQQQQKNRRLMKNQNQILVRDLRKAGLNPMLAYGKPGAPLSAASAALKNPLESAIATALDVRRQKAEIANIEADTKGKQNENQKFEEVGKGILANTIHTAKQAVKSSVEQVFPGGVPTIKESIDKNMPMPKRGKNNKPHKH